jgi:hypothetical protein
MPKRRLPKTLKKTPEQIAEEHLWCPMEVRQRGPHVGLYCAQHGTWIKWIGQKDAAKIQDIL